MPFFGKKNIAKVYTSKNNKPSLWDRNPVFLNLIKYTNLLSCPKKRVSSFISYQSYKATMTLEAALVMPCFLFAMLGLISIMDVMKIKGCMDVAVAEVGNNLAIETYGESINEFRTSFYIQRKINSFLKNNLSETDYQKVSGDIRITELTVSEEKNIISFKVNYKIVPGFNVLELATVKMFTTYYGHDWLGFRTEQEVEKMVFLSDNAEVYHLNKGCKYLNTTIVEISYANLSKYRNNSGEKYRDCNFCNAKTITNVVYITPEGRNYHTIRKCIGLTRSIHTVPLSSVKEKRVCSGCGE